MTPMADFPGSQGYSRAHTVPPGHALDSDLQMRLTRTRLTPITMATHTKYAKGAEKFSSLSIIIRR